MLGETAVLRTRVPAGRDGYGNDVSAWTDSEVPGCVVWPGFAVMGSDPSKEAGGNRQTSVTGMTVFLPAGVVVSHVDRMVVRGQEWEVDADPSTWTSPWTGATPGQQIVLRRVVG